MTGKYLILLFVSLLSACATVSNVTSHSNTLVLAHRASSGLWIQNSRNAVENTVQLYSNNKGMFQGIEVDIVLTKDNVPVLAHDPWVHKSLCVRTDKSPLKEELIKDILWEDLQRDYRCGAAVDKDFPNAKTKSETILGFDEFLSIVKRTPSLIVYLDIKLQEPLTASAKNYANAIFKRWDAAALANPLYVEGPNASAISSYLQHTKNPFTAVISFPPFYAKENIKVKGAVVALTAFIHPSSGLKEVTQANAGAIAVHTAILNSTMQRKLQLAKKQVIVFTPNSRKDILKVCNSGVDMVITDYPNLARCKAQ
jgi:glycerophosphoryl diester phosphodiesterase